MRKNFSIIKKIFTLAMSFLVVLGGFTASVEPSYASIATDTLTIKVGYQGGPFYTKASFSWRELDELYGGVLPSHEVVYSYYSGKKTSRSNGRNVVVSARGFYIKDLLDYVGIDTSSIAGFEFYTDDQKYGAFTTFTKKELLDTPRYYFPNMGVDDDGNQIALDGGDITRGMTQVQSMFALESNWEWDAVASNFSSMSSTGRFHLLFGQEYVSEARTSQAAKYVHTINVIFSGAPVIGTESNIELKVGTDYRVQVNVTAADTELENYIKENLVWSSNNTDIIEVDQYGNLTIKGDGTATITARSGDTVGTVTITTGDGSGTGTGAGDSGDASGESGADSEKSDATEAENSEVSYSENSQGVYILSKDFMEQTENAEWVNSVLKHAVTTDNAEGSVMNWRTEEMDDDATQLVVTEEDPVSMGVVFAALFAVFLLGVLFGPVLYKYGRRDTSKAHVKKKIRDAAHH